MSIAQDAPLTLRRCFQECRDPRREHLRAHSLWDIVALTICAMICGCDTIVEIQKYGLNKFDFLKTFLDLENGIPSHDTIGRVFSLLDPQQFRACFATWVESLAQSVTGRVIAIDGKTLRRSHEKDQSPLHVVTAFAIENRLVLSQQATDAKSNEITAIPELLQLLNVKKAIITIDAMGCQKEIAAQIKAQGGHYVLGLKGNQPNLHEDVQELFQAGLESDFKDMDQQQHTTEEKSHGRIEKRTYHMLRPSAEWLLNHPEWIGLKTLGMVLSERQVEGKNETFDIRYFISSLPLNVKVLANAVRGHWAIENNLHWVLDVCFREDDNRSRKDHTGDNLAWIRRVTASLLAQDETKVGVVCKRKMAGWDDEMLLRIIGKVLD